jgi:hypothetical protein
MANQNQDYINGAFYHLTQAVEGTTIVNKTNPSGLLVSGLLIFSLISGFCITFTGYHAIAKELIECSGHCEKDVSINPFSVFIFSLITFVIFITLLPLPFNEEINSEAMQKSLSLAVRDLEKVRYMDPEIYSIFLEQMTELLNQIDIESNDPNYIAIVSNKLEIEQFLLNSSRFLEE